MIEIERGLRAGEWVEVQSADEIPRMLDAEGALDGMPFMPEMLDYLPAGAVHRKHPVSYIWQAAEGRA